MTDAVFLGGREKVLGLPQFALGPDTTFPVVLHGKNSVYVLHDRVKRCHLAQVATDDLSSQALQFFGCGGLR
jgi:hypothetical protein